LEVKNDFLKISLPRAEQKHSAKKYVPRVFEFALGKEASLPRVFSLPGVFCSFGKDFFIESLLFSSRQRKEL
jgi:hypothetical protein